MSKAIRFRNDIYLDSSSVNVGRFNLANVINRLYNNGGWDYDSPIKEKTFSLFPFGAYILTTANVGNGNLYGHSMFLILTGQNTETTSKIVKIVDNDTTSIEFINQLKIKVKYPSSYHFTTLTRLNVR